MSNFTFIDCPDCGKAIALTPWAEQYGTVYCPHEWRLVKLPARPAVVDIDLTLEPDVIELDYSSDLEYDVEDLRPLNAEEDRALDESFAGIPVFIDLTGEDDAPAQAAMARADFDTERLKIQDEIAECNRMQLEAAHRLDRQAVEIICDRRGRLRELDRHLADLYEAAFPNNNQ